MATSSKPWKMTRGQRLEMTKTLGVPPDYFEGMTLDPKANASDKQRQETEAYFEALMTVVSERMKHHP